MSQDVPSITLELTWQETLRFAGRAGAISLDVDSDGKTAPSPVQVLAFALAGCMSVDVVHILERGRLPLRALATRLQAWRAPTEPRRLVRVALHFEARGDVAPDRMERAIALSRKKYCSVWHSLRPDIVLETTFAIAP
jgi:putative redox protein